MRTMGRIAALGTAFVVIAGPLPVAAGGPDPQQRLRAGEVVIESQARRHGGIVDARIFVPAPPRLVYTLVADPAQAPRYSPEIVAVTVLEDQGSRKRVRMRVRQMGLIDDESEVLSTYQPYELVTWQQVKGRFAAQEGAWKVASMNEGTLLRYHLNVDVGTNIPAFIIEAFLRTTIPALLKNVRRQFGGAAALPTFFAGLPQAAIPPDRF
jgi:ribosome-associated toxin RatA of RatAB toxin-antitoxin module